VKAASLRLSTLMGEKERVAESWTKASEVGGCYKALLGSLKKQARRGGEITEGGAGKGGNAKAVQCGRPCENSEAIKKKGS